ncbi:unnamed protein product [Dovyalis caffra]|uniref:Secreted protein n=1 Tax=Dovyalis caffra TaxID=77055 RepID=A0AAV1R3Z8_9ROSI|nr:unnamed protein product [Dovyalis caffra]
MDWLNISLGSLVLTLMCGIHSRSALGITSSSGWNSSQNPTTSPTLLPPTLSQSTPIKAFPGCRLEQRPLEVSSVAYTHARHTGYIEKAA